jgi:hypothetical protein
VEKIIVHLTNLAEVQRQALEQGHTNYANGGDDRPLSELSDEELIEMRNNANN